MEKGPSLGDTGEEKIGKYQPTSHEAKSLDLGKLEKFHILNELGLETYQ